MWVPPFRDPWINGYLLLPMAFRSLSRLSSALSAKASTLRSFLLDLFDTIALVSSLLKKAFVNNFWFILGCLDILKRFLFFHQSFFCMKFSRYIITST